MAEGERQASSRIFISYRREDSAGFVRALLGPFGNVSAPTASSRTPITFAGSGLRQHHPARARILQSAPRRHRQRVDDGRGSENQDRRLDNPNDYLRLEVATALNNEHVIVIPVLVDRAGMPRSRICRTISRPSLVETPLN